MKFLVAFAVAVAVVHADVSHVVQSGEAGASILRSEGEVKPDGFQYSFETSNGIAASETGVVKDINSDHPTQVVSGEFRFTSPEGTPIAVNYVADENGFQPKGDHLPVPPPIPELILRSLDWIAAHPQAEEKVAPRVVQASAQASAQAYKPVQSAFNNKRF